MGAVKFDPQRDHGTVIGMPGVAFVQDNRYFTPIGDEFVLETEEAPKSKGGRPRKAE